MTMNDYAPVKQLIESKALALRDATPVNKKGRHSLHLADACTQVLQSSPSLWLLYQQAVGGAEKLPSEFQRGRRRSARPSQAERSWWVIEDLSRTLVSASESPISLRTAVMRIVGADPSLYERYAEASRRERRAKARRG